MTLKELHFFYKLSENPQVTSLAKELNISQSAISLAIKSLETSLGEKLFNRVGKKLILNEKGRFFKEKTYIHYQNLIDAKNLFLKNKLVGNLKVASSKTISNYIMPKIYFDFLSKHNEVKLEISTLNSSKIIENILNSTLDIALIETNITNINIVKEKLCNDELIVVTSDKMCPKSIFIDSIQKKWILREAGSGTRDTFINKIKNLTDELNVFMELNDFEEIKTIVKNSKDCITALSKVVVIKEIANGELFEVKLKNIELQREFFLIYHKDKSKNLLFETFKEFIKNRFISLKN